MGMVRIKDQRLPKRSETKEKGGCRNQGRPQIKWEDRLKIDRRKAEEEESGEKSSTTGSKGKHNYIESSRDE